MAGIDDKVEALKQKVAAVETKVENQLKGLPESLTEIKTDLKWHRGVGWTIVGIFVAAFLWLLNFYIPDKLNDKIAAIQSKLPDNFADRFSKMEANLQNVQDRISHITPTSLNELIPPPTASPTMISAQLRKASRVIDVALRTRIPAASKSLAPLILRVADIRNRYKDNSQIRSAADAIDARLAGYEIASKVMLNGAESTTDPKTALEGRPSSWWSDFTAICGLPTDHVFNPRTPEGAVYFRNIFIFQVRVKTCTQMLDGNTWTNDEFVDSTIEYDGGPLYLADSTFTNCKFKFGNNPNSRAALAVIESSKGKPVSFVVSGVVDSN